QLDTDGSTTKHDYIAVNGTPVKDVYDMQFAHNTLYASNQSRGKIHTNASNTSLIGIYSCANELWKKVTLSGETNRIIPDPEDPTISWVEGAMGKGFHRLKDGVLNLTITNSPATNNNIIHLQFDDKNNLWVETFQGHVSYLPAKYRFDETIDTDKWVSYGQFFVNFRSWKDVFFITRSGAKFRSLAYDGFHAWTDDINKNIQYTSSNVITQDGAYFCPTDHYDFYEDSKGRVWASSGNGVYYFKSSDVGQHPLSVIRPKVPRNDGSGLADYLLDGITVYQIREDASGYKWIATASGLFKVSNDGTEILETFTTANAPFSSDVVYSVCPNLNNNSVYVGTPDGLFEYYSTTTPPQEDFSNVVAYPNPIRPDYTGPVTITGLMNNTLVKIVNVGGETVATLQSSGGTAIW
ncbi:MAG: hypothetical protein HUJ98_14460, partial [Bacteroidaceae bacterium]|nr:hypothetical protein [Bacteroidaceae bacterium]